MSDSTLSLVTLGVVVVLFVWNRFPVEFVAVGAALSLYFTGVLSLEQSLAGFGDPAVILIAALFIVSEGLDATGVTTWIGQGLASASGRSLRRLLLLTMLLSAAVTSIIGLNGAVAALLPVVVITAMRRSVNPSRLLMPLAFAGSAGGMLLLTASPVNVVISEAAKDAGVGAFGFAEFGIAGIPLVAGTVLVVLLFGRRLLPDRTSDSLPPDLSDQAKTLVRHYGLSNVTHLRVVAGSVLVGHARAGWDLARYPGATIITVLDGATGAPVSDGVVAVGDRLTMLADPLTASQFAVDHGVGVERVRTGADIEQSLLNREWGAAEVVIPPRSAYVGREVRPSQVVNGDIIVLAVEREGKDRGGRPTRLQAGDALLVEGPWSSLEAGSRDHDLLVVDSPELVRRQTVPLGRRSLPAIGILVAMVVLLATGAVPAVVATMLAAGAMIVLRVVTVQQAYRGISWTTVLLVAGMIPMSTAIAQSGAGEDIARLIVDSVGDAGPTVLLIALFVITVAFGQLISNTATALIMIPIAVSAAAQLDVSARPVLMSLCVASAVAFLTPVATPANMMVMSPGGYRFGDYWRLGLPLVGVFFVVAVVLVPLVWHF